MEKIIDSLIEFQSVRKSLLFHGVSNTEFYKTLNENPSLENQYVRAQAAMAELLAEEIIEISDTDHDAARARNRIDTRKWYAGKTKPHKFGDRIDLNVNQIVDIGSALAEAKSRVVSEIPQSSQVIDNIKQIANQTTGYEPVDPTETRDANENDPEDIFN